jgi:hypothetical protein
MSTLKAINLVHPTSSTNNIVLDSSGNMTAGGTLTMSSSFMRNRIINGAMVIDQRNAGASITPTDAQFTVDRWKSSLNVASKFSLQQSTTAPAGFINSILATSLSAYSIGAGEVTGIQQQIEGFNTADFGWGTASAQAVTVSFWVRSSLTGTFGGSLRNSASNRSYPFSYTISAANTFEYKTITIAGDTSGTWLTNNGIGVMLYFAFGAGSTFSSTAGSWQTGNFISTTGATSLVGTNGATFYITGVQLEVGTAATPFEREIYSETLAKCQRYYQKQLSNNSRWLPTMYQESQYLYGVIPLQVYMRVGPSVTIPLAASFDIWGVGAPTAVIADSSINERVVLRFTRTGLTNYSAYILSGNGISYVEFSAEL